MAHHYLQHGGEGLGVLGHAADVEPAGEDGPVVVLVVDVDEHLGRVGWGENRDTAGWGLAGRFWSLRLSAV